MSLPTAHNVLRARQASSDSKACVVASLRRWHGVVVAARSRATSNAPKPLRRAGEHTIVPITRHEEYTLRPHPAGSSPRDHLNHRPEIKQEDPLDLSISLSGGKETN